jgi:hypothetical protein
MRKTTHKTKHKVKHKVKHKTKSTFICSRSASLGIQYKQVGQRGNKPDTSNLDKTMRD